MKTEQSFYGVSENTFLKPLLKRKVPAILIHWFFQGLLYMDTTERLFKTGCDLVLAALFSWILVQWFPLSLSLVIGLLAAHTVNFLCNAQLYVVLKHFGNVHHTKAELDAYIKGLKTRVATEPAIRYAAAYGSLARGEMNATSDLDVRFVRFPGIIYGFRACWFTLRERSRALWNGFPLDVYVLDSEKLLCRLRADEQPVILKESS